MQNYSVRSDIRVHSAKLQGPLELRLLPDNFLRDICLRRFGLLQINHAKELNL
jgi:hypothetical protein